MSRKLRPGTLVWASIIILIALGAGSATADTTSIPPTKPTAGTKEIPNPGAIRVEPDRWLVVSTSGWDGKDRNFVGEPSGTGTWSDINMKLLDKRPDWASPKAYWAPSIVRRTDGKYVVFYSAEVKDTNERRCIGTGVSKGTSISPAAIPDTQDFLFAAVDKPLVCWNGQGADNPSDDPDFTDTGYKIIDATPAELDTDGQNGRELYLTYKTSKDLGTQKHSTIRMVRLDPNNPESKVFGTAKSRQLTEITSVTIEENPVMVQSAPGRFVLFTSRGLFDSNCSNTGNNPYETYYRTSTNAWQWGAPTKLTFPASFDSCGSGNAHIAQMPNGNWRIFFNGKYRAPFNAPAPDDRPQWQDIPFGMYIGRLDFDGAKPFVPLVYE